MWYGGFMKTIKLNTADLQESYDRSLAEEKERDQKREELVRRLENIAELAKVSKDAVEIYKHVITGKRMYSDTCTSLAKRDAETAEYNLQVAIQTLANEQVPR